MSNPRDDQWDQWDQLDQWDQSGSWWFFSFPFSSECNSFMFGEPV
jgi:hypothetical protein